MEGNCIEVQHFENQKLLKMYIFYLQWSEGKGLEFANQILMTNHSENSCKFMIS